MSASPSAGDERASIGLTTLVAALFGCTLSLVLIGAAADVVRTRAVAQTAADAAALAAVQASPVVAGTGDPTGAATAAARVNGARVTRCRCDAVDHAQVEVLARPRLGLVRRVLGGVPATARAELVGRGQPTDARGLTLPAP